MTTASQRTLRIGERRVSIVMPSVLDARLHTALVIISIHVVGITALGFRVSVPQILAAILTAAAIDVALALRRIGALVWPSSGMLTGSGVALILRETGMGRGDYWSWSGWYYFALIAGLSVLTKHLIRYRGTHVFNPSNLGLVAAFVILGSQVIEPLDFWWAPMSLWMALAYLIIIGGGTLITRRLDLLGMVAGFWVVFAMALGVLAGSGHCMTAAWSLDAVCGARFWSVLVTSPEVLIFMFFMITDPKTIPSGRLARLAFAGSMAIAAVLLIAPQQGEFGAKVALLASLVLWSPLRGLFDRLAHESPSSGIADLGRRLHPAGQRRSAAFGRGALMGSAIVVVAIAIVLAGSPAREAPTAGAASSPATGITIDPSALPPVTVADDVRSLSLDIDQAAARDLAINLAENLAIEGQAIRQGNGNLLADASAGERLAEMQAQLDEALATGERVAFDYRFESLLLRVADRGEGQSGAALVFEADGTVDRVVHDALGEEKSRTSSEFSAEFTLRQLGSDRWLIVSHTPDGTNVG